MRRLAVLVALALAAPLPACGVYSFSGATLPEGVRTVAIPPVDNAAPIPIPTLPADLTRLLVERFTQRTRLRLDQTPETADATLEAQIQSYRVEPTAVTATDVAARNRLTIGLQVRFARRGAEGPQATLVDRVFTASTDYDPSAAPAQREAEAAQVVLRTLADDVLTAATSNW